MTLSVGVARRIITPKVGGLLFGYNDHTRSKSVNDDLTVTALYFKTEKTTAILLSATVCLISTDLVDEIRKKIESKTGIPGCNIIVSATHTHSGPVTTEFKGFESFGYIDREYCDSIFIPNCIDVCVAAMENPKEALMGVGTTNSNVGINRRQLLENNTVTLGQNPWGPYDSTMTVISFVDANEKKPLANIVHVGAHPTAAGINTEITRDWVGVMMDRLDIESGATTLFINGTLGDVAPRMANGGSTGDLKHAMEVGGLAGIDAVRAFKSIRTYYDEAFKVVYGKIKIPFKPPIPKDDIPDLLNKCTKNEKFKYASLMKLQKMYENKNMGSDNWTYNQVLFRIGPVVLVPYPFEVFSEIGLRLRNYSPYAHTLTISCTNGCNSYLPTQSQICRGGYEINSFLWFRPRQLPDDTDFRLIKQNLKLIKKF